MVNGSANRLRETAFFSLLAIGYLLFAFDHFSIHHFTIHHLHH
jgi:hypothetical protein